MLPNDTARGAQVFARDLRELLDGDGAEHRILTLFAAPAAGLDADHALDVPAGAARALGLEPRVLLRLHRALLELAPDVVVAHGGEPLKYLALVDRGQARLVYLAIGTVTEAARSGPRRFLYRWLMSRADVVAGVSRETLEEAERVFAVPRYRTVLLPNGRDPTLFRPGARRDGGPTKLLFVGHLTDSKRPLRFVSAVDELARTGHDVTALIVGEGPLEAEARRAASRSGRVRLLGRRHDVAELLRSGDLFVLTSLPEGEGMPGVLIEAALSGLPVVTTAVPGASSVVVDGKTGFVVPPDDDEALVAALERLVVDRELRTSMGLAAREHAVEHFSLEQAAEAWRALLDSLSEGDRQRRPSPLPAARRRRTTGGGGRRLDSDGAGPDYGAFVISLDFELHWGLRHRGRADPSTSRALGDARQAVLRMLELFSESRISATWATVGFLFAGTKSELDAFSPDRRPRYVRPELNPYLQEVGRDEEEDQLHLARSLVEAISSHPGQEVASHTFSHYLCLEDGQDEAAFRSDLVAARRIAEARGTELRSIVFPSNQVNAAYLPLLKELGFVAYRGAQPGLLHRPSQKKDEAMALRLARTADCYLPLQPSSLQRWDQLVDANGLCNVAASRFLRPYRPSPPLLEPLRLHRVISALEEAARSRRLFHLWWHPHNFGANGEENLAFLAEVIGAFERLRESHGMRSMTMAEVADEALSAAARR